MENNNSHFIPENTSGEVQVKRFGVRVCEEARLYHYVESPKSDACRRKSRRQVIVSNW